MSFQIRNGMVHEVTEWSRAEIYEHWVEGSGFKPQALPLARRNC